MPTFIINIYNSGNLFINNYLFQNISNFGESMIFVSGGISVNINGIIIDNWTLSTEENYYYYKHISSSGYSNITGLVIANTDLKNRAAVYLSSVPSLVLTNSSISNSIIYSENILIYANILFELKIDGLNFTQIIPSVSGDSSNYLLGFDSFDLSQDTKFSINNIIISQCQLAFLSFSKVYNPSSTPSTFIISDFHYVDSTFTDSNDLISFKKLEQTIEFSIILSNIEFDNITFIDKGNLLLFQQQLSNYLLISNISITNTNNAGIFLKSSNKLDSLLPVQVVIQNMTANYNKLDVSSFITVSDNAILNISDSIVSRWSTSGAGAFLTSNAARSEVNINSSTIRNNNASQGGAFFADSNGVIRVYNSLIQRNNASTSGVILITNNGGFEFYGWNITLNTAIDAPISRIFDSSYLSIINNCMISYNTVGGNNGTNTYPIQLISSSIIITNSTIISNQYSILNSFVSRVTFEDSIIQNNEFNDSAIQTIGTIFTFANMRLDSLSIYESGPVSSSLSTAQYIIQSTMYCDVNIDNVSYINSNLALIIAQQSTSIINNITVNSVISNGLITIDNAENTTISNVNINSYISKYPIYLTNSYAYLVENIVATGVNGGKINKINNSCITYHHQFNI